MDVSSSKKKTAPSSSSAVDKQNLPRFSFGKPISEAEFLELKRKGLVKCAPIQVVADQKK
jgi:hypothetical protein